MLVTCTSISRYLWWADKRNWTLLNNVLLCQSITLILISIGLKEVKYNKISQLGILKWWPCLLDGDYQLLEVNFTVNEGTDFWEFHNCLFYWGWPPNRGQCNRGFLLILPPSILLCSCNWQFFSMFNISHITSIVILFVANCKCWHSMICGKLCLRHKNLVYQQSW